MSASKEVVKSKIKPEVEALSGIFTKAMALDKKTGIVTIGDKVYQENLPEGVTVEVVEKLQSYNSTVAAAAAHAVGTMANPIIKKDKELNRVTMSMPTVGKDIFEVVFDRSREVPSRDENNVPNGTTTKFGSISVSHKMYAAKARGQLKEVKEMLAEQATALYGK